MSNSVESAIEMYRRKKKSKRLFRFRPNKVSKIEPIGNRRRGTKCPEARSGHRIVVGEGNLYVFGGYSPQPSGRNSDGEQDSVLFRELWKFNCASRTWTNLETHGKMPEQLASHSAVLINNQMLVFGGTGVPFGDCSSNSTHICNLDTLEWTLVHTTGCPPSEQYGQAMAVHKNKMYVVGGTNGYDYSMNVHCLDLASKEWRILERENMAGLYSESHHVPEPRYRHEIAIEDNQLFVFGGGTAFSSFGFREIPVFDLEECLWRYLPTSEEYPAPRRCHGSVQMGSDVFICGGHDGSTIFSDVWKINLKCLQWEKLSVTLPTPVYFHSATLSEAGQLFVFGGVKNIRENKRTNELFTMWLKIPSLAEICWQAVLKYTPYIAQVEKKKLFESGVPLQYIKQIDFDNCDTKNGQLQTV